MFPSPQSTAPSVLDQLSIRAGQQAPAPYAHPTELYIPGTRDRMITSSGEINAYDKRDAQRRNKQLVMACQTGALHRFEVTSAQASAEEANRRHLLIAAVQGDDRAFTAVADQMTGFLYETANRAGFMRRSLKKIPLAQGGIPRIPVSYKTTYGYAAASTANITTSEARGKYLLPPLITLGANVQVSEIEIFENPGDIYTVKLLEAREATEVQEDRMLIRLLNQVAGLDNPVTSIQGSLTPETFAKARGRIQSWNLPVSLALMSAQIYNTLIASESFGAWFDPVTQYQIVQTGEIGTLAGTRIVTDATRVPTQHVIGANDLYLLTSPQYLGGYCDTGPLTAVELNMAAIGQGTPGRGWALSENIAMAMVGGRGVARAQVSGLL